MSAWVCSKAHIDAMVTAGIELGSEMSGHPSVTYRSGEDWKKIDLIAHITTDEIGQMLTDTIVTGVHHRYPGDDVSKGELPGPSGGEAVWYLKPYKWERTRALADGEIVALLAAYDYQACEHNDYTNTFGHRFVEHCRHRLLKRVEKKFEALGGKTEWGYEEEHVFDDCKQWAVVMRAVEFRPHCGGPLVLVPARSAEAAIENAAKWYDGEPQAAAIHEGDLLPEEIEAEAKRNAEWVAEQNKPAEPEISLIAYAIELRGTGVALVRLEAESGEAAMKLAVETYGGEAVEWYPHPTPLTDAEIQEAKARLTPPEAPPAPRVKALDPNVDKLLEELAALGEPPADETIIRNSRK